MAMVIASENYLDSKWQQAGELLKPLALDVSGIKLLNTIIRWTDSSGITIGDSKSADGKYALAMGNLNTADASYAVAVGESSTASGVCAVAMGDINYGTADYAVAMGLWNKASDGL